MTTTLHQSALNLVDGQWQSAPAQLEVRNPADLRELVATRPSMDAAGVHAAFDAAERAAAAWRSTSQVDRGRVLLRAAQLLRDRRDELSRTLTREMGKTLAEARGEVGKAADFFEYYGGLGRAERRERCSRTRTAEVLSWTVHEPLGVVLAITPWNDPLLTPARKLAPALIAGNSVVLKPASDTPVIALELARVLADAGLPAGVLNTVTGAGRSIGAALLEHPALRAVSFTGSNEVGESLQGIARRSRRAPAGRARREERRRRARRRRHRARRREHRGGCLRARPASAARRPAASWCSARCCPRCVTAWCRPRRLTSSGPASMPASRWVLWCRPPSGSPSSGSWTVRWRAARRRRRHRVGRHTRARVLPRPRRAERRRPEHGDLDRGGLRPGGRAGRL